MGLDIGAALRDGFDRTVERNGGLIIGIFLVLGLIDEVVSQTLSRANRSLLREVMPTVLERYPWGAELIEVPTPWALPVGYGGAIALTIAVAVLAEAVRIVAVRTFVSVETATIRSEHRRRLAWATLNGVVGGLIVLLLVGIGLVLLIVPGVFLAVSFFFVRQAIAVEDENAIDALVESWALTAGNRTELFALAAIVVVFGLVASAVSGAVFGLVDPAAARLAAVAVGAVTAVFGVAVAARAYDQLRTERAARLGHDRP